MSAKETVFMNAVRGVLPLAIRTQWEYLPVWKEWESIVGPETALHAWPHHIDLNGVLFLMVSDSIWMQQLSFQRHVLLTTLNQRLQHRKLLDIRMFLGDVQKMRGVFEKMQKNYGEKGHGVKNDVPERLKETADALVEPIKDDELRWLVKQLYLVSETVTNRA